MTPRHALNQLAAPLRYRVAQDAEGWPIIPGRYGRLEWHAGRELAVYTYGPRLFARLWAISGVRRWQVGDREARALLPVATLPQIAVLIGAPPETVAELGGGSETLWAPHSQGDFGRLGARLAPEAGSR